MYSTITISLIVELSCFLFSLSNFLTVSYSRVCRKGNYDQGKTESLRVAIQSTAMGTQDNALGNLDEKLQIGKGSACHDMVNLWRDLLHVTINILILLKIMCLHSFPKSRSLPFDFVFSSPFPKSHINVWKGKTLLFFPYIRTKTSYHI